MALYRCPKCGEIVSGGLSARRCLTCGLSFDMDHEPVPDDDGGKPENVRKKEKRARIIVAIVIVIVLVGAIIFAIGNGKSYLEHVRRWR